MSITDELRKWVHEHVVYGLQTTLEPPDRPLAFGTKEEVLSIADRIDAEHKRQMQEQPYTIDMVPITDESMAEHGWVRLPVDADGVPIRVGDEVSYIGMTRCERVTWIAYGEDGEHHVNTTGGSYTHPDMLRHHHEPTISEILDELEGMRGYGESTYEDVVTRCAELSSMLRKLLEKEGA